MNSSLDNPGYEKTLGCGWENEILLTGWEKEDFDETEQLDEYPVTWKVRKPALHLTKETNLFGETNWVKGERKQTLGEDELAEVEAKITTQEKHHVRTIATVECEW